MRDRLEKLMNWRIRTGQKPVCVWIWYGFGPMKYRGQFDIDANKPSKTDDYRAILGTIVVVCAKTYTPALMEEFDRMKGYAARLTLWVEAWSDDPASIITWDKSKNADLH